MLFDVVIMYYDKQSEKECVHTFKNINAKNTKIAEGIAIERSIIRFGERLEKGGGFFVEAVIRK